MFHIIKQKRCHRGGFTIVELLAAIFILTACIVAFSQLTVFVVSQRTAEGIRQKAVDQVQNVLEQIAAVPEEKLISLDFDKKEYEAATAQVVPDGKLTFSSKPANETATVQSYIFEVSVSWNREGNLPRGDVSMFRLLTVSKNGKGGIEQ